MNYITGPFYGRYDKYIELLKKLELSSDDNLFILGNAIGYDKDSMRLLLELSYSGNVFLLMGKQEYLAKTLLPLLPDAEDINESILSLDGERRSDFLEWVRIGGYEIARSFFEMDSGEREGVLEYLAELDCAVELDGGGRSFVLAHCAPRGFEEGDDIFSFADRDFAFGSTDYRRRYFPSSFFVTAAAPTDSIPGGSFGKVYSGKNKHISLATLDPSQGRAAALCVDSMRVTYGSYVELSE